MRYGTERVTERKSTGQFLHLKAYVPRATYDAVRRAAFEAKVTQSEWLRRAIEGALSEDGELQEMKALGSKLFPGGVLTGIEKNYTKGKE